MCSQRHLELTNLKVCCMSGYIPPAKNCIHNATDKLPLKLNIKVVFHEEVAVVSGTNTSLGEEECSHRPICRSTETTRGEHSTATPHGASLDAENTDIVLTHLTRCGWQPWASFYLSKNK
jgi:hypothetical protein